jgi:hypothetical protein
MAIVVSSKVNLLNAILLSLMGQRARGCVPPREYKRSQYEARRNGTHPQNGLYSLTLATWLCPGPDGQGALCTQVAPRVNFGELRYGEVRRILIPRTRVNKPDLDLGALLVTLRVYTS